MEKYLIFFWHFEETTATSQIWHCWKCYSHCFSSCKTHCCLVMLFLQYIQDDVIFWVLLQASIERNSCRNITVQTQIFFVFFSGFFGFFLDLSSIASNVHLKQFIIHFKQLFMYLHDVWYLNVCYESYFESYWHTKKYQNFKTNCLDPTERNLLTYKKIKI